MNTFFKYGLCCHNDSMLPTNGKSVKKLMIEDKLHIAAIDFMFLELAPQDMVTLQGIARKGNRWVLMDGIHSLNYGQDGHQACYIRVTRERCGNNNNNDNEHNGICKVEFSGEEPTKTIEKLLGAKRIKVINESFIREIDIFLMKEKDMSKNGNVAIDIVPVPMDDIYTLNKANTKGYMILHKETHDSQKSYTIDVVGDHYKNIIEDILNGNADRVRVVNCSVVNEQIFVRIMDKVPLQTMFPCQQTVVDYIINAYSASKTKNITVLISGSAGIGKSTVAFGVAQMMKKRLSVDPYLIKGFNVNCDEMQYHPIINHYSPKYSSPVVLLLDEFDIALANATTPPANNAGNNTAHAISANKTNLNNFLDSINDEQFLITIATTNIPLAQLTSTYGVFCRKGRFHKWCEVKTKDIVDMVDPV
jgi:hypothetical protein